MPKILVFDVNETLLDLGALDAFFEKTFGDPTVRREWFLQMIQSALVSIVTNSYVDFGTVGRAALEMTAARRDTPLLESDREGIMDAMERLPPHPDVHGALDRLRAAGLRMATLTNSALETANAQLSHAGLTEYFEAVFSADEVRRLKPASDAYRMVGSRMRVEMSDLRLVTAHAWDVAGALRAGCAAAFVGRRGMVPDPLVPAPDIVGADLEEVAGRIIEAERRAA